MKRIDFFSSNRSGDVLHIETEGCIVNVRVNLHDEKGNEVTSIEILPDGDYDLDGYINNRLIRKPR